MTQVEQDNRSFLATWDPRLLQALEGVDDSHVTLEATAQGPTLRIEDWYAHDTEEPRTSAAAQLPPQPKPLHLHFGFGLGYFLDADTPTPQGNVLVYEPDPAILRCALRHIPLEPLLRSKRATLCTNFARFQYIVMRTKARRGTYRYFVNRPHGMRYNGELAQFQRLLSQLSGAASISGGNRLTRTILTSTLNSLEDHLRCPGFQHLRNSLSQKPAVLIAAGPSLERNLAHLVAHRHKVVVFAVARVTKLLERYGLEPDFLVHVEAQDFFSFIQPCRNLSRTTFLLADQTDVRYYRFPHRATFGFQSRTNALINSLVAAHPEARAEIVKTGGSVATAACFLAFLAGCNPIVLIGQDLALTGGRHHAGKSGGSEERTRTVPGYYGGTVTTIPNYHNNIIWYQEALKAFAQMDPQRQIINATEGGAVLKNFPRVPLRAVLAALPNKPIDVTLPDIHEDRSHLAAPFRAELLAFNQRISEAAASFAPLEEALQDALLNGEDLPDPGPQLRAYLAHMEGQEYWEHMVKPEVATLRMMLKRLDMTDNHNHRLQAWAALAAAFQGSLL